MFLHKTILSGAAFFISAKKLSDYQVIDKGSAKVLHNYPDAVLAIKHLLKVDNDRDL